MNRLLIIIVAVVIVSATTPPPHSSLDVSEIPPEPQTEVAAEHRNNQGILAVIIVFSVIGAVLVAVVGAVLVNYFGHHLLLPVPPPLVPNDDEINNDIEMVEDQQQIDVEDFNEEQDSADGNEKLNYHSLSKRVAIPSIVLSCYPYSFSPAVNTWESNTLYTSYSQLFPTPADAFHRIFSLRRYWVLGRFDLGSCGSTRLCLSDDL
ncbi:hypothetical protein ACFE04_008949 [Oxalis oulophora]